MRKFENYLNIHPQELKSYDFVIFLGAKGAGKTSYIEFCQKGDKKSMAIDEVKRIGQIFMPFRARKKGQTIYVGSSMPKIYFFIYKLFFKTKIFDLNQATHKIRRELEKRNIDYNEEAIQVFIREYGASFTKLEFILNEYPCRTFTYSVKRALHDKNKGRFFLSA